VVVSFIGGKKNVLIMPQENGKPLSN